MADKNYPIECGGMAAWGFYNRRYHIDSSTDTGSTKTV